MDAMRQQDKNDLYIEEKPPKKHRFAKGFVCGILLTFLVIAALGFVGFRALYRSANVMITVTNPSDTENGGDSLDIDAVAEKLSLLELYIDQTYLYDYSAEDLEDGIYRGFLDALGDPYTVYYTAEEYASMMQNTEGSYNGIGVQVSQDTQTGLITILRVFHDSPAEEAGIEPGDILYKVEETEVTGVDLDTVVTWIKGDEGSSVSITVFRPETGKYLEMNMDRRQIEIDTVDYGMLDEKVGYILITEFDEPTASQFAGALEKLQAQGMTSLIIDLRDNPGGLVSSVVEIADMLVPEGRIVYMESKFGTVQEYFSEEDYLDIPLAVLVNGESASAAEILAGAVRDYGVGTLVGTNTYGKGIAQTIFPLQDGSAVKITTADYYTPSGENIHGIGIAPDIEVKMTSTEEDTQLDAAWEFLTGK